MYFVNDSDGRDGQWQSGRGTVPLKPDGQLTASDASFELRLYSMRVRLLGSTEGDLLISRRLPPSMVVGAVCNTQASNWASNSFLERSARMYSLSNSDKPISSSKSASSITRWACVGNTIHGGASIFEWHQTMY